jgi:hypothetical protein
VYVGEGTGRDTTLCLPLSLPLSLSHTPGRHLEASASCLKRLARCFHRRPCIGLDWIGLIRFEIRDLRISWYFQRRSLVRIWRGGSQRGRAIAATSLQQHARLDILSRYIIAYACRMHTIYTYVKYASMHACMCVCARARVGCSQIPTHVDITHFDTRRKINQPTTAVKSKVRVPSTACP